MEGKVDEEDTSGMTQGRAVVGRYFLAALWRRVHEESLTAADQRLVALMRLA